MGVILVFEWDVLPPLEAAFFVEFIYRP